jgi:signal transduction histidine kinase
MAEEASPVRPGAALDAGARLETEKQKLALVHEIGRALSSALDLESLLGLIMRRVTEIMEADRSTLYLVSEGGDELWSKVEQGGEYVEIRLKVGEGIAGWVAQSGETVNIADAYIDDRFQPRVDLESGYRTRSILCAPMRGSQGQIIGVLQLLNKKDGPFTGDDEELLASLAAPAAVAVENSLLYHSVLAKNRELVRAQRELEQKRSELNVLYEIERQLSAAHDLDELLDRLTQRAMAMLEADAGSIALRDRGSPRLRFRTTAGPAAERLRHRSLEMGEGIIGWVAARRQAVIVNDPATDERHAVEFARTVGASPRNVIAAPLVADDEVVGAIELLDKRPRGRGFSEADLKLLTLIAGQASRAIQIAESKQQWVDENRLAAIGKMLAGVLHDLKTPMTIISGYAQLMAQIETAGERETYVEQILHQFDMMAGMTREVLAFARGESNVLIRKVYLHRFLAEVSEQLRHTFAGRDVELVLETEYDGVAYFDQQSIFRLIHNLARNAVQAMQYGGRFTIRTSASGNQLRFEFSDTGTGIPAGLEDRLFDLFATGHSGGTGLGLAICKKIVGEHGGTIENPPAEQGARFVVTLPLRPKSGSGSGKELDETGPFVKPAL